MIRHRGYEKTAHLYDLFGRKPNVDFYHGYAGKSGEALDVGAGTGLVAVPLAQKGIKVWCVEPSREMFFEFNKKLAKNPVLGDKITLIPADAEDFDAGHKFDFCFMSAAFDHFLSDRERAVSLANIARHLNPGGRLVFDVYFGCMETEELSPAGEASDGAFIYRRYVGGKVRGNIKEYLLVFEKYRGDELLARIEQPSSAGITNYRQIQDLLSRAGFSIAARYSDYERTPFVEGDELCVVEAARKEE